MTLNPRLKFLFDVLPLAVFFIGFKWFGLFTATAALLAVTVIILAVTYGVERKIALAPLITAIVVGIFGGLTLWLHNDTFIKIKPTLISLIFAGILFGGCIARKGLIRYLLSAAFNLTDRGWYLLSLRYGLFFLCLAALNEYVWRNFPTGIWVNFKVFGLMGLTMLFAIAQMGFVKRHSKD